MVLILLNQYPYFELKEVFLSKPDCYQTPINMWLILCITKREEPDIQAMYISQVKLGYAVVVVTRKHWNVNNLKCVFLAHAIFPSWVAGGGGGVGGGSVLFSL